MNQEGSRKKVRRRKAVVLVHGVLGSFEHSKQRRGLCGALQHRSCLGCGRMQADTQSSGAHVAQSEGAVFPGSLPGLIFPVVFSVWCVHVPGTQILESPVLTVIGMYVYVYMKVFLCMMLGTIWLGLLSMESGLFWPVVPVQHLAW